MKIAALVPYRPDFCAGQRFRIELWARHFRTRDIQVALYPFADAALTDVLYHPGKRLRKAAEMLRCYAAQLRRVVRADPPDAVYIYREAALLGPAWIERLVRRWRVPLFYDIDEPLFVPYVSPRNGRLNALKCASKTHALFRMSDCVMAVNRAIGDYAAAYSSRVAIVPMAVDTDRYRPTPERRDEGPLRIGWVGTRTTQANLHVVAEPLRALQEQHPSVLRVVADEPMSLPGVALDFIPWSYDQEVARLSECQIGIVPVHVDSEWSRWKFFFKLIQFMALGLPVVASRIGSNAEIIEDGVNGFLVDSGDEWRDRLSVLIRDPALRLSMGRAARQTVERQFSLTGQIEELERLFRSRLA